MSEVAMTGHRRLATLWRGMNQARPSERLQKQVPDIMHDTDRTYKGIVPQSRCVGRA